MACSTVKGDEANDVSQATPEGQCYYGAGSLDGGNVGKEARVVARFARQDIGGRRSAPGGRREHEVICRASGFPGNKPSSSLMLAAVPPSRDVRDFAAMPSTALGWLRRFGDGSLISSQGQEVAMRMMLRWTVPVERGNETIVDGSLARTIESLMEELKPEAAYF